MILNTTFKNETNRYFPVLYIPIDPKYVYPAKNSLPVTGWYQNQLPAANNYPTSWSGLDDLMNQRRDVIDSKIGMLVADVYQRYALKSQNLYHIDLDQCTCRNLIYLLGDHYMDKRRIELERKIIDLEQEKRQEKAGYFRDIMFLKKDLRESLIEKLEEEQKAKMFLGQEDEQPCNV